VISDCAASSSNGNAYGGALSAYGGATVELTDVQITGCTATTSGNAWAMGGALYVSQLARLRLAFVAFDGNRASNPTSDNAAQGSAIYATAVPNSLLTDCTFHNHDVTITSMIHVDSDLHWHCPRGKWAPLAGRIPRTGQSPDFSGCPYECPSGTFGDRHNITDAAECQSCRTGHYCSELGLAEPHPCPVGTRMRSRGARSIDDCLDCGAGQFNNQTAQKECRPCPPGSFAAEDGATACTACPSGGWCPDAGGSSRLVLRE